MFLRRPVWRHFFKKKPSGSGRPVGAHKDKKKHRQEHRVLIQMAHRFFPPATVHDHVVDQRLSASGILSHPDEPMSPPVSTSKVPPTLHSSRRHAFLSPDVQVQLFLNVWFFVSGHICVAWFYIPIRRRISTTQARPTPRTQVRRDI
jgi:hypothetical protein